MAVDAAFRLLDAHRLKGKGMEPRNLSVVMMGYCCRLLSLISNLTFVSQGEVVPTSFIKTSNFQTLLKRSAEPSWLNDCYDQKMTRSGFDMHGTRLFKKEQKVQKVQEVRHSLAVLLLPSSRCSR